MKKATLQTVARDVRAILKRLPQASAAAANDAALKPAKGEIYVGGHIAPDGKATHTFLLPGEFEGDWNAALAWAKKQGGDLPTRIEQSMLWAHHAKHFQKRYYWSNEQYAFLDGYAWLQSFGYGYQYGWHKDFKFMARAVRRVTL